MEVSLENIPDRLARGHRVFRPRHLIYEGVLTPGTRRTSASLAELTMLVIRESLPASRLSVAFTNTQITPPQKLTIAAKSSAAVQPNLVAIYAQVFIKPESEPACPGVKSMQVAHQLGAAK